VEASDLSDLERAVVAACVEMAMEVVTRPVPEPWDVFGRRLLAEELEFGPRWSPSVWFNNGRPVPERFRVRFRKAVGRLEAEGVVACANKGGRLAHVRLTVEGERVAALILDATPPTSGPDATPARPHRPEV
jgi:hypothetical protein